MLPILVLLLAVVSSLRVADTNRYVVRFSEHEAREKALLAKLGGRILFDLPIIRGAAVHISEEHLHEFKESSILSIERDQPRHMMESRIGKKVPVAPVTSQAAQVTPYGITQSQADILSEGTDESVVCIIDSGYNKGHEDLPANPGGDGSISGDMNPFTDGCGHGTHVAGTIAALNNEIGVVGVTQDASLYIVKVFGNDCAWAYSSDLIGAVSACVDGRSKVTISMSLGCTAVLDGCFSQAENQTFANVYAQGHLSIAAAGNAGNSQRSYPASYASVVSVGAIDEDEVIASFSQFNDQVEVVAAGVAVDSTVPMGTGEDAYLAVIDTSFDILAMDGSPKGVAVGPLVDCGIGDKVCPAAKSVCLIARGTTPFAEKVLNCSAGGGVGAIIYNNAAGIFAGTLNGVATTIPSASLSQADGQTLLKNIGATATLSLTVSNYASYDGTSMATPHVSGVAAKLWAHNKAWSNQQIRDALKATAKPLGGSQPNNYYGYGLIQANEALKYLQSHP